MKALFSMVSSARMVFSNVSRAEEVRFHFSSSSSIAFVSCSTLGLILNGGALIYASHSFDNLRQVRQARKANNYLLIRPIFLLITLDCLTSSVGSLAVLIPSIGFLLNDQEQNSYLSCSAFFLGLYFPAPVGLAFSALVAAFRWELQ